MRQFTYISGKSLPGKLQYLEGSHSFFYASDDKRARVEMASDDAGVLARSAHLSAVFESPNFDSSAVIVADMRLLVPSLAQQWLRLGALFEVMEGARIVADGVVDGSIPLDR